MRPARYAAALAAAALLLAPAAAGAITFGSPLTQPASVDFDCTAIPGGPPSGATSCTYSAGPVAPDPALGDEARLDITSGPLVVPAGSGRLTAMRVLAGATTGPMQFVVLRSRVLRASVGGVVRTTRLCCTTTAVSPVFTPAPNAVTTVPMNAVVRHDTREPGLGEILAVDSIGISVLAPGVSLPLRDAPATSGSPVGLFPATVAGAETTRLEICPQRLEVLVNADWEPGPPESRPPSVVLVRVAGRRLSVTLRCAGPGPCTGTLHVESRPATAAGPRSRYATARFSLAAGRTSTLAAPFRGAIRRGSRVWVNITAADGTRPATRVTVRG